MKYSHYVVLYRIFSKHRVRDLAMNQRISDPSSSIHSGWETKKKKKEILEKACSIVRVA